MSDLNLRLNGIEKAAFPPRNCGWPCSGTGLFSIASCQSNRRGPLRFRVSHGPAVELPPRGAWPRLDTEPHQRRPSNGRKLVLIRFSRLGVVTFRKGSDQSPILKLRL